MSVAEYLLGWNLAAILCLVLGLACMIYEMFTPGMGIPGLLGIIFLTAAVVLRADSLLTAGITILLILIPLIIAAIIIFRSFSKGALSRSPLVLKDQIQGDSTGLGVEDMQKLVGREGVSLTPLRPSGNGDFDGEKLDVVSADVIKKIINGESGVNAATSESLLFRLVDPNKWYAAFITSPSEGASLMGGQTYTVTFDGMKDIMYTATALEPVVCDGGIVNMLEFTENIGELLSIRVIKATVTAQLAGLEMNAAAVKSKNGESYITTSTGDVPVTVIALNGDKALITGDGLVEGMRYKK